MNISVVIPAFNEAHRLPKTLQALQEYLSLHSQLFQLDKLVIVDDGSSDVTQNVVSEHKIKWPAIELLVLQKNSGKGRAVREGLLFCLENTQKTDWILMADADGATDWSGLEKAQALIRSREDLFLVMGSRQHPESVLTPRQPIYREFLGKCFNFLLRSVTNIPFKDTQCGFKIFKKDQRLKKLLSLLTVDRFAWDAEAIMFCRGLGFEVGEIPVAWSHRVDSHVHMVFDSLEMLLSLLRIRLSVARRINRE